MKIVKVEIIDRHYYDEEYDVLWLKEYYSDCSVTYNKYIKRK